MIMSRGTTIDAYVLINVPNASREVIEWLYEDEFTSKYIVEVVAVFGGADVIARINVQSMKELHDLVIERIQRNPKVDTTQTYFINPMLRRGR